MAADAPYDVAIRSVIAQPYRRHRPGRKVAVVREPRCRSGSKSLIFRTDAGYCRGFWSCFIERAEAVWCITTTSNQSACGVEPPAITQTGSSGGRRRTSDRLSTEVVMFLPVQAALRSPPGRRRRPGCCRAGGR